MKVIVLSDVSGSGKSMYAKTLNGRIVSADSYFMRDGAYVFEPNKLGEAHADCFRNFIQYMSGSKRDDDTLVVDNTNTTVEEISPYMLGAAAFGWEAEVHTLYLTLHDDAIRSAARNVHNVPEQVVLSQYQRLLSRKLPSYWKCVSKSARF